MEALASASIFCCSSSNIPQSSPSIILTLFLKTLHNFRTSKQLQRESLFPPYILPDTSSPAPESKKVIEIESVQQNYLGRNRQTKFFVYLEGKGENEAKGIKKEGKTFLEFHMHPEEAFREVKEQVVDGWYAQRKEWWDKDVNKRDESMGWICKKCKVEYHARVLTVADDDK